MSSMYIQEPPSNGKVLLTTTLGDIDIELWSKEAPKACRNFVQLCMERYYDNTIFHRVEKGFIAQGGDPTGTGTGGDSIYGTPFKDEFHQRLKFNRRGLVAMANAGPDDNGSQFFFTLGAAIELNKKHTIFGKVTGDTIYNMIRFDDLDVDAENRPFCPPKVIKSQVLFNPFDDIEPREIKRLHDDKEEKKEKGKSKSKATKNYKLLSFGEEAEEDEEETDQVTKELHIKSSHDVLHDPKLSSIPAVEATGKEQKIEGSKLSTDKRTGKMLDTEEDDDELDGHEKSKDDREKSKKKKKRKHKITQDEVPVKEKIVSDMKEGIDESEGDESDDDKKQKKKKKNKESNINTKLLQISRGEKPIEEKSLNKEEAYNQPEKNDLLVQLAKEREQFLKKKKKDSILKKGKSRQEDTLALLASFESKVNSFVSKGSEDSDETSWLTHTLKFEDPHDDAKDANMKGGDWYDIYDPRNPINERRREKSGKEDKKSTE